MKPTKKQITLTQLWLQGKSKNSVAVEMGIDRRLVDRRLLATLRYLYEGK